MLDGAVMQPVLKRELLMDLKRAFPLLDADQTVRQRAEVAAQGLEVAGVLGAVEQLQPHHVADRHLSFDEVAVEGYPRVAAGDSGPRPRARVRQNHLREPSRTAHIVQRR